MEFCQTLEGFFREWERFRGDRGEGRKGKVTNVSPLWTQPKILCFFLTLESQRCIAELIGPSSWADILMHWMFVGDMLAWLWDSILGLSNH